MRQNPLRLHATDATAFEQNGEAEAFRAWLQRHRPELAPETQQALVRHLARSITNFGPAAINTALDDLATFELRLRVTVALEPSLPTYATRHWRRAIRHYVAAAYGMTGREARRVLDRPRRTLTQARRAETRPFTLQNPHAGVATDAGAATAGTEGDAPGDTGPAARRQPSIDGLVAATRDTWSILQRVGDPEPDTADRLISAQLSCLSMPTKAGLVTEAGLETAPIPGGAPTEGPLADILDATLTRWLRQRLAAAPRRTGQLGRPQ